MTAADDECANVLGSVPLESDDRNSFLLYTASGFRTDEDARKVVTRMSPIRQLAETTEENGLASPLKGIRKRSEGIFYCAVGFVPQCRSWALLARSRSNKVIDVQAFTREGTFESQRLLLERFVSAANDVLRTRPDPHA